MGLGDPINCNHGTGSGARRCRECPPVESSALPSDIGEEFGDSRGLNLSCIDGMHHQKQEVSSDSGVQFELSRQEMGRYAAIGHFVGQSTYIVH